VVENVTPKLVQKYELTQFNFGCAACKPHQG